MPKRMLLVSLMFVLSFQQVLCMPVKEDRQTGKTDAFLDKIRDEEVRIKLKDGTKIKGVFRELKAGVIFLEKSEGELAEIPVKEIAKLERTRDAASVTGGVLLGILAGTGLFIGVLIAMLFSDGRF